MFARPFVTPLDAFKAFPEAAKPILELSEAILRGPSPFTASERELIAAHVSGLNKCKYCWQVHVETARQLDPSLELPATPQELALRRADRRMGPVLEFAGKLTEAPSSIGDADIRSLKTAGWDEIAVFHLVCVVALLNFMNRFVEGLRIEATEQRTRQAAEQLAKSGYAPLLRAIARMEPSPG
jgi:uncharacterized peroxidase-related enzyme